MSDVIDPRRLTARAPAAVSPVFYRAYATAQDHFDAGRYREAISTLEPAFCNHRPSGRLESDETRLRDAALLVARTHQQLREFSQCREWIALCRAHRWLDHDDPEAMVIELWMRIHESAYDEVVRVSERFIADPARKNDAVIADFLFLRGVARRWLGQPALAMSDFEAALGLFKSQGKKREEAEVSNFIGLVHFRAARYETAIEWFARSRVLNENLALVQKVADNLQNIGLALYKQRSLTESERCFLEVLATPDLTVDRLCRAEIALGHIQRLKKDHAAAREHLKRAYVLAAEHDMPRERSLALEFLGDVYLDLELPLQAQEYFMRAMIIARETAPDGDLAMELERRLGECLILLGRGDEAEHHLDRALELALVHEDESEIQEIDRCRILAASRVACA